MVLVQAGSITEGERGTRKKINSQHRNLCDEKTFCGCDVKLPLAEKKAWNLEYGQVGPDPPSRQSRGRFATTSVMTKMHQIVQTTERV